MPPEPTADAAVVNDPEAKRYELAVDGTTAGFAEYVMTGDGHDTIVFTHTVIHDEFEGRGLGGRLAKAALDDARVRGLRVTPQCPFIARYIERHPEYADLLRPG